MTYLLLDLVFLAVVALVALAAILARRAPRWRLVGLAAIPLVIMTAVFDNVIVGTGIVAYDPDRISGARLGVAPLEDFSYAIAAVVLLPALWTLLAPAGARGARGAAAPANAAPVGERAPHADRARPHGPRSRRSRPSEQSGADPR